MSRTSGRATSSGCLQDHDNELDRPEDYINHSLYFEAKTFLHGLLVIEDKLSMAHSPGNAGAVHRQRPGRFRHAVPRQPEAEQSRRGRPHQRERAGQQIGRYFQKTSDGKQILRDVMSRYIPDEITQRKSRASRHPMPVGSRARASNSSSAS
jgi:asparagine synthase (glutamine-hydrolysing)